MKKLHFGTKMKALFVLLIVFAVASMFFFNAVTLILSNRYPLSVDMSANAIYEIGDESKTLLETLTDNVTIYVLAEEASFDGNAYLTQARNILNQYPKHSDNVKLEYVNFAADPTIAARFADLSLSEGDILVCARENVKQLALANLFNYTYSSANGGLVIKSSRAEEAITSAIAAVLSDQTIRIGILTGNGTADMSVLTALLRDNNYEIENVSLLNGVLDDYDGLMLCAPVVDLSEDVLARLDEYLYNNGEYGKTLVYTADVSQGTLPNLEAFLAEWGVVVGDGAVFETQADRTYNYQPFYPVASYTDEERASKLKDRQTPFLAPLSKPLSLAFKVRDSHYTEEILSFYESSGVRPSDAAEDFTASQATIHGPLPAMVLASNRILGTTGVTQMRSNLLVSASTQAFGQAALQNSSVSNMEYILNLFNDLFARENVINIESKSLTKATLGVTMQQANRIAVILVGVVPAVILLSGMIIWLRRRYR